MFRFLFVAAAAYALPAADLRLGIVGTDTSHVTAFAKVLNDASNPDHVPGARIVAAYKGGSPDLKSSADRVEGYAKELSEKFGVKIVPSIADLCGQVDAILLESVDGRKHLPQMREVVKCAKPVFIDKPLASTLADAREIARVAKAANVKWFTSSSLRYAGYAKDLRHDDLTGAISWGPGPTDPTHQLDLSWYGIHALEALYAILGPGCEVLTRTVTEASDETTCRWKGGKLGTVRVIRPYSDFGAVAFRPKEILQSPPKAKYSYVDLLKEVVKFFQTGQPPVPESETLEMFAFMDAAQRSKEQGGIPVKLAAH